MRLTSLDKALWPKGRFTKADLLTYYAGVASRLLPHLSGRAVTLGRWPNGLDEPGFAQTECRGRPGWMQTVPVRLRSGEVRHHCALDDLPSLLWAANQNTVELHALLHRADDPDRPTHALFDLDPGPGVDPLRCCEVALWVREALEERGVASWPTASGGAGLHVHVPMGPGRTYEDALTLVRSVAAALTGRYPDRVTETVKGGEREGRVLVDWRQNGPTRTTIVPYSMRAADRPAVAAPLSWAEVESALARADPGVFRLSPQRVLE